MAFESKQNRVFHIIVSFLNVVVLQKQTSKVLNTTTFVFVEKQNVGLVFAEGSAVHGRQLLGRLEQDVLILNRRSGTRMVPAQLDARCKLLTYAEPIAHFAAPRDAAGSPLADRGLALPGLPALARALDACGLDLARHWNTEGFRTEVSRDVAAWAAAMRLLPEVDTNLTRPVLGALEAASRELPGL